MSPSHVDALGIRRRLGRALWGVPEQMGPDGWMLTGTPPNVGSIIVTCATWGGADWQHASIARPSMPTYRDLCQLHAAAWPRGHAYQAFVPPDRHVNIHPTALHLWGRLDGASLFPEELDAMLDRLGSI